MTSKISCFDHAVFRRALKMTAPVWILYTLYELLLPLRLFSFCRGLSSGADNYIVQIEKTLLSYARFNASIVPFLLGGLLAWVLFSWLFRAGTAYFYAALPVRRETLFLTNYLTGVLLCAAPALLSSLLLWAVGAGFGAAAFVPAMQVFAAAMLGFLLFFSFAVLVCCVVGQMAAMPIVYVILNFTFFVLEAIVRHLLFTFVYGMPYSQSSTMQSFALHATPVLGLLQGGFRVATDWAERDGMYYMELNPQLEGWGYLGALAALGLQKRQYENELNEKKHAILASLSAGDRSYDEFIDAYVVDKDGRRVDGEDVFALLNDLPGTFEAGKFPIFEARDGRVVIPVTGMGLWGPVWGYVALEKDMNTVAGIIMAHKGETPGLGAEIATPKYQANFVGKTIFDGDKFVSVTLRKGGAKDPAHEVDAISGGTKTSDGVTAMLYNSLENYLPLLEAKRNATAPAPAEVSNEENVENNE